MKRVGLKTDAKAIVRATIERLGQLTGPVPESREEIRDTVRKLVDVTRHQRELTLNRLQHLTQARSARERILAYLLLFVGEPVQGEELYVVSAISEYPRRVRELRVEWGYNISTGHSQPQELRPDEYRLESAEPDQAAARKWKTANAIRRRKDLGSQDRLLELLKAFPGQVLTGEQMAYVARASEWGRRTRELRTEEGWRVATKKTGRPDLGPSEYVLESLEQAAPHDRHIGDAIYATVLQRDRHQCQRKRCGWTPSKRVPGDPRQFIELHHIEHHKTGGANNEDNLITLCNVCHDDVHRRKLSGPSFFLWLGT